VDGHPFERGDGFAVDSSSPPPFDHRKQCGTETHIGMPRVFSGRRETRGSAQEFESSDVSLAVASQNSDA
jgi:hypothetical protein